MAGPGLLALHHELSQHADATWADALAPLAEEFAQRFKAYLPKLTYPIRVGTHPNSSFGLLLAHEWADARDPELAALIERQAQDWFGADQNCQAWEPGGDEFLSSALTEALLMSRLLDRAAFTAWFAGVPARGGGAATGHLVHPGGGLRPDGRQDRASGRA